MEEQLSCGVPGQHCLCQITFQNKLAKTTAPMARANLERAGAQPQFDLAPANRQLTAGQVALMNVVHGYRSEPIKMIEISQLQLFAMMCAAEVDTR